MTHIIYAYDNNNAPIIGTDNTVVPLCYFNELLLQQGQQYTYDLPHHETCIVPLYGTVTVAVAGRSFTVGSRTDLWQGVPNGVYVPIGMAATITCDSGDTNVFIAGGKYDTQLVPFAIGDTDVDIVQYGCDTTKTHRKIKHILGQKNADKRGRLLVSELFTVGSGGWSGFPPHKHDTDRMPDESRYEEVYQFRFNPPHGSGIQMLQQHGAEVGDCYHLKHRTTFMIDRGYHPCVAMPGYEMYYFTIIVGDTQKSLVQYFQPEHAYQVDTIPGIKDMIAKFK